MLDFISDDLCARSLNNQDALVVVVRDNVGVGETFDAELSRDSDFVVIEIE